ncbi:MAG: hypothetical protein C0524_00685 [Rhodobacter sp.]|nr:hypothetical protein [Rhodobacter sp.]
MGVLAEYPGTANGQIGQEVLRRFSVKNLARSTPLFEGGFVQEVFGSEAGTEADIRLAVIPESPRRMRSGCCPRPVWPKNLAPRPRFPPLASTVKHWPLRWPPSPGRRAF